MRTLIFFLFAVLFQRDSWAGPVGKRCTDLFVRVAAGLPALKKQDRLATRFLFARLYHEPNYSLRADELDLVQRLGLAEEVKTVRDAAGFKQSLNRVLLPYKILNGRDFKRFKKRRYKKIVSQIMKDPEAKLSEKELKFLAKQKINEETLRYLSRKHKDLAKKLVAFSRGKPLLYLSLVAAAVGAEQNLGEELVPPEKLLSDDAIGEDEFELIYSQATNIPGNIHPDIRIGDTMYDFNGGFILADLGTVSFEKSKHLLKNSLRVRFKLTKEEVKKFRDYLQGETGKVYPYLPVPMLTMCITATHRAVKQGSGVYIPGGVDRSATLTKLWFKMQNFTGLGSVISVKLYSDGKQSKTEGLPMHFIDAFPNIFLFPESWFLSQFEPLPQTF